MENKAILMSIQPQWVCKILNGEKTIEVRKKFPKDYVGWVYIYCTKDRKQCLIKNNVNKRYHLDTYYWDEFESNLNGKVVARFWCDKVEEIAQAKLDTGVGYDYIYDTDTLLAQDFEKKCCLSNWDLLDYFGYKYGNGEIVGCAIHISKLEVFDKPKELKEFYKVGAWKVFEEQFDSSYLKREQQEIMEELDQTIAKAPQSWCYIEGEND